MKAIYLLLQENKMNNGRLSLGTNKKLCNPLRGRGGRSAKVWGGSIWLNPSINKASQKIQMLLMKINFFLAKIQTKKSFCDKKQKDN